MSEAGCGRAVEPARRPSHTKNCQRSTSMTKHGRTKQFSLCGSTDQYNTLRGTAFDSCCGLIETHQCTESNDAEIRPIRIFQASTSALDLALMRLRRKLEGFAFSNIATVNVYPFRTALSTHCLNEADDVFSCRADLSEESEKWRLRILVWRRTFASSR